MGWIPWRCHDRALAADFIHRSKWSFYQDANVTGIAVGKEEVLSGRWDELYVDYDFQLFSCAYTWKKTRRAALSGVVLDGYAGDGHQT
ncbi:hypothetical protein Micbo1qcDRAFT_168464, partial [Microdochium bolleyi]